MYYPDFLKELDAKLENFFKSHKEFLHCKAGCANCCKKGDYPISEIELKYLMQGYIKLDNSVKQKIQNNIKNIKKSEACPFLIDDLCSVYEYRPIICRVHGLAYVCKDKIVKIPYCVNDGKNYSSVFVNGEFIIEPIKEKLDTLDILKEFDCGEIRNLYDWINNIDN